MAKYYGRVGYAITKETPANSGVWVDEIVERHYYGDTILRKSRWESRGEVNDNLNVTNEISILADPFAYQNFSSIKYAELMGDLWRVTSVEIQRPRLILTIGGVYNGE